jgi:hypothetical protein
MFVSDQAGCSRCRDAGRAPTIPSRRRRALAPFQNGEPVRRSTSERLCRRASAPYRPRRGPGRASPAAIEERSDLTITQMLESRRLELNIDQLPPLPRPPDQDLSGVTRDVCRKWQIRTGEGRNASLGKHPERIPGRCRRTPQSRRPRHRNALHIARRPTSGHDCCRARCRRHLGPSHHRGSLVHYASTTGSAMTCPFVVRRCAYPKVDMRTGHPLS